MTNCCSKNRIASVTFFSFLFFRTLSYSVALCKGRKCMRYDFVANDLKDRALEFCKITLYFPCVSFL